MESNKLKGFSHPRNNEIHDIMDKPTGWIIKWGTSILMLFVVIIIVCSCFIKYPEKTMSIIEKGSLDTFTHNKSIQKICESMRVEKDVKNFLKNFKKIC